MNSANPQQMSIGEILRAAPEQVDITSRKHKGSKTSQEASKRTNRERDCARIIAHLEKVGSATVWEIHQALGMPYQTASGRCADLKYRLKKVVETGTRRPTGTGSMAAVLRLCVEGDQ